DTSRVNLHEKRNRSLQIQPEGGVKTALTDELGQSHDLHAGWSLRQFETAGCVEDGVVANFEDGRNIT
ncbi:MAG: hypothetical protein ORO03_04510, partial [Alphaproteobacteria bacterium]|nr:hypothetical protein [Alphaproteobacteria bacterium]